MKSIIITLSIVIIVVIVGLTAFYFIQASDLKQFKIAQNNELNNINVSSTVSSTTDNPTSTDNSDLNLLSVAKNNGSFKIFSVMIRYAGLDVMLKSQGPYTILAPTDNAFGKLDRETSQKILSDKQFLTEIIKNHIISGAYTLSDLNQKDKINNLNNIDLVVNKSSSTTINGASVIGPDIMATNGIIQGIDSVFINK